MMRIRRSGPSTGSRRQISWAGTQPDVRPSAVGREAPEASGRELQRRAAREPLLRQRPAVERAFADLRVEGAVEVLPAQRGRQAHGEQAVFDHDGAARGRADGGADLPGEPVGPAVGRLEVALAVMPDAPRPVAAHLVHALRKAPGRAGAGLAQARAEDGFQRLQAGAAREIDAALATPAISIEPGLTFEATARTKVEVGPADGSDRVPSRIRALRRSTVAQQGREEVIDLDHAGVERRTQPSDEGLVMVIHDAFFQIGSGQRGGSESKPPWARRRGPRSRAWDGPAGARLGSLEMVDEAQAEDGQGDRPSADREQGGDDEPGKARSGEREHDGCAQRPSADLRQRAAEVSPQFVAAEDDEATAAAGLFGHGLYLPEPEHLVGSVRRTVLRRTRRLRRRRSSAAEAKQIVGDG